MFLQETLTTLYPDSIKACRAIHAHKGSSRNADELEFNTGDIILVHYEGPQNLYWVMGCLDADRTKTGLISVHFIKFFDEDEDQSVKRPKCIATKQNYISHESNLLDLGSLSWVDELDKAGNLRYVYELGKKYFSHPGDPDELHFSLKPKIFTRGDELTFKKGDVILILDEVSPRPHYRVGCLEADRTKIGIVSIHSIELLDGDDDGRVIRPKCLATEYYTKRNNSELTFRKGDVICILDYKSVRKHWLVGHQPGSRYFDEGYVSIHFVKFLDEDEEQRVPRPKCRAKTDIYHFSKRYELLFKRGDVILILDEYDVEGGLYGCLKGDVNKKGYFHSSHVELLATDVGGQDNDLYLDFLRSFNLS